MDIQLIGPLVLLIGGAAAYAMRSCDRRANIAGAASVIAALVWQLATCSRLGSAAAWFQLPICAIGIAAALHSPGYMAGHGEKRMGSYWLWINLTLSAMLGVTVCKGMLSFLVVWEIMGLASFALVAFDWHKKAVQKAAWIYLLACEAGGLLLMAILAFPDINETLKLCLIIAAFGLKAGFPLLHFWLPEAHPAAPAPVSALMSGAMIVLGFYGIFSWMPEAFALAAAGWILLVLGVIGALGGILFGAAQADLKRLLAYSSIENVGIIAMAFGLGILGKTANLQLMSFLAMAGAYLHIFNHALLKGTLFLGAGSVYKAMHTLDMDKMGGLMKKMPWTGGIFSCAALGICGLPPFCGFTGELLIYIAALVGIGYGSGALLAGSLAVALALAMTGAVAAAALAKCVASVFSGEDRSEAAANVQGELQSMVLPQLLLIAVACSITFTAPFILAGPLSALCGVTEAATVTFGASVLLRNAIFALALLTIIGFLILIRYKLLPRSKDNPVRVTWDCGYAKPTSRMQYTATAFTQPLVDLFHGLLHSKKDLAKPQGLFPDFAAITENTPDGSTRWVWNRIFKAFSAIAVWVHRFQSGYLHLYILIMLLAIAAMLLWGFGTLPAVEKIVEAAK